MKFVLPALKNRIYQTLLLLLLSVHLLTVSAFSQPDLDTRQFTLSQINFEGLKTIELSKALAASGLQQGQTVNLQQLKETAQRLLASGLFRHVKFQYKYLDDNLAATFVVSERQPSMPCHFDNFAWFTDEELHSAIRQELPDFAGKVPEGGEMVETIRRTLEKLLRAHKLAGSVETELANMGAVQVFKATDVKLPVCQLSFSGVTAVAEKQLHEVTQEMLGAEYSRIVSGLIARETVIPLYLEKGYLKASVRWAKAQISQTAGKCQNQVVLVMPIEEGQSYHWNAPGWTGNQLFKAEILTHWLALNPGDVADGLKIRKGMTLAAGEYMKRGYLGIQMDPRPEFDEVARTVTYSFTVEEGPQYQVGELSLKGFSTAESKVLMEYWQPLIGKPYDASMLEGIRRKLQTDPRKVTTNLNPNHQTREAHLQLESH